MFFSVECVLSEINLKQNMCFIRVFLVKCRLRSLRSEEIAVKIKKNKNKIDRMTDM